MIPGEYGEHGRSSEYDWESRAIGVFISTPVLGGSMRIGNRLGGCVIGAFVAVLGMAAGAQAAERVTTVPLGGSLAGQNRRPLLMASTSRRGSAASSRSRRPPARSSSSRSRPQRRERTNGQEVGLDQQGWYTFRVVGAEKPYTVETTFVQVGQSTQEALELLLLADQGRLRSTSPGPGATAGSTRMRGPRRRRAGRHRRAATSLPGRTSSGPGPTACSRPCPPPATTRPGSPTCTTT